MSIGMCTACRLAAFAARLLQYVSCVSRSREVRQGSNGRGNCGSAECRQLVEENIVSQTGWIILIVVLVLVFGGGGGYYWRSRR